jgi:hypothetical protein
MKLTIFRKVRPELKDMLKGGIGPDKARLTKLQARRTGGGALAAYAPMVAYSVQRRFTDGLVGRVGPSNEAGAGRRARKVPDQMIERTVMGGRISITRASQAKMIGKIRKRRRVRKSQIRRFIPRIGSVMVWPERDYVTEYERREGAAVGRVFAGYYRAKLLGRRL